MQKLDLINKHAKNFALIGGERKELEGIHYREDGAIVITNSHILLYVKDGHNMKESVVKHYSTGKVMDCKYPNLDFLIKNENYNSELNINMSHLGRNLDVLTVVVKAIATVGVLKDNLTLKVIGATNESYELTFKGVVSQSFSPVSIKVNDLYKGLQVFKDLSVDKIYLKILNPSYPMCITDKSGEVKVYISPVRRH